MNETRMTRAGHKVCSVVLNNFVNDYRVLKTCRSLAVAGYEVHVIALHDGASDLPQEEVVHGIPVSRLQLTTKRWWRIPVIQHLKYVEFIIRACRKAKGADVYHCNDLSALPIGVICKYLTNRKARVVYDAHEHESERNGFSAATRYLTRLLERLLIRRADRVITVSPSIAQDYARLYGIVPPTVIYNAPIYIEKQPRNILRSKLGIGASQRIFVYQGGLMKGRGIEILLRVFANLYKEHCVVLIGGGPLAELAQDYANKYSNIFHVPNVDPMTLWELTFSADYGIALIENTCKSYYFCLPNKLFEFMMAELPVIVSDMLELKNFVSEYKVGVVSAVSEEALRRAIDKIVQSDYSEYVANIRQVKTKFTWERQEQVLLEIYSQLTNATAGECRDRVPGQCQS